MMSVSSWSSFSSSSSDIMSPWRSLLKSRFQGRITTPGTLISVNPTHWSNEKETLKLLDSVIKPYCELAWLSPEQKALIIWDAFKRHICDSVKIRAKELNIVTADVPNNLTHLLSPTDFTANRSIKQMERNSHCTRLNASRMRWPNSLIWTLLR